MNHISVFLIAAVIGLLPMSRNAQATPKTLYGPDNRLEINESPDSRHAWLAQGTVGLVRRSRLIPDVSQTGLTFSALPLGAVENLCPGTRFEHQPALTHCTGVLVGLDLVLTAGHCFDEEHVCANTQVLFDWRVSAQGVAPSSASPSDVYSCRQILARGSRRDQDFALIQLDRPAFGRFPVPMPIQSQARPGTPLFMLGHPDGLPMKAAAGAVVQDDRHPAFLRASLDAFQGNSGSPVFSADTLKLEGILTGGNADYRETREGCRVPFRCTGDQCGAGEGVLRTAVFAPTVEYFRLRSEP